MTNIKPYSFKLDLDDPEEAAFAVSIERWKAEKHTIKTMVKTLLAKYEGLQAPIPSNEAWIVRELRRLDLITRQLLAVQATFERKQEEIIEIALEINSSTRDTVTEVLEDPIHTLNSMRQAATGWTPHHNNHHEQPLENQVAPTLLPEDILYLG